MTKKRFLYFKQVVMRTSGTNATLRSILRNSIGIFLPRVWTAYAHKSKACLASCPFLFSDKLWSFFACFRIVVSVVSLNKTTKRQAFWLLVGAWSIPCQKIASKIRKLSGAYAAKQRLWQYLGWPSSYVQLSFGFVHRTANTHHRLTVSRPTLPTTCIYCSIRRSGDQGALHEISQAFHYSSPRKGYPEPLKCGARSSTSPPTAES